MRSNDDGRRVVEQAEAGRLPQHPRACLPRHRIVAQHELIPALLQALETFRTVRCLVDLVTFDGERRHHHAAHVFLVFDDEDRSSARFHDTSVSRRTRRRR